MFIGATIKNVVEVLWSKVSIKVFARHVFSISHTGYEPACGVWYTGSMRKMEEWKKWEIKEISEGEEGWPERLKTVKPDIKKLYYRGEWQRQIFKHCLAVVGTRKMTSYGESVIEKILPQVVQAGVTIVSGFMYGVDTKAHQTCLDYDGKTVAVLGSGLDQLTPKSNDKLYTEVLESGGLVMSEYEKNVMARLYTFPQRNRIVAGLSQATLVIEGGEKSGTLITAKLTIKQDKPVLAVPGPVGSSMAKATNGLLKEGATLVTSAEDVLMVLGIRSGSELTRGVRNHTGIEGRIVEELEREALDMDELSRKLKMSVVELGQKLSELQLKGIVEERLGKYTCK